MTRRDTSRTPASGQRGRRVSKLPMTLLDWFGLVCLLLMAVCSLISYGILAILPILIDAKEAIRWHCFLSKM